MPCGIGCQSCPNSNGYCQRCAQGYLVQNNNKDCKILTEKLKMVSVLFDNIKTALKVKFESDIRLKNKNELVVLLTDKGKGTGKYVEVLIKQVRSWR